MTQPIYGFDVMLSGLFLALPLLMLTGAIWLWARSAPKIGEPVWRYHVAFAALGLAGLSSLLWLILGIWANVIGGFPNDPMFLSLYRWGFLTSVGGLLTSFGAKGRLRWPTCGLSCLMMFMWFVASSE
jgi:hypothetical protein